MSLSAYDQAIVMSLNQKNNKFNLKKKEDPTMVSSRAARGSRH